MSCNHRPLPPALQSLSLVGLLCLSAAPVCAQTQRMSGNPFKPPAATVHYARTRDYHVSHLKLLFDIDAANHSATGVVTHTLTPLRSGLDKIVMDAGSNLKISECRIDGQTARFTHTEDVLTLQPVSPLARGKEVTVEIHYLMPGGRTEGGANGLGGFHWIDPRPGDPSRRPAFWTQGETNTNSNWVPCYDYPNDKCTSETITTVPENWVVVGNGKEGPVGHDAARHTKTYRWTMTQPHSTYLLSLVGGELDIRKGMWQDVPLYYVVPKGKADLIPGSFGNTPDMLQFFSDKLGVKYAWPKYAQSAMYDFGGGMENVSATTLGAFSLTDMRNGHFTMSSLNSHELAHQWFGDLVTCKDWGDIWLNESFATFFEMLYMEHLDGKERYDEEKESNLRSYLNEAQRYKRPLSTKLYASQDAMFDSHTYPKGGLILHMLRHQLGDDNLFRGLGHYLKVNRYTPVDSHDLSKAITEATGINVESFFDQWIFKPGHPILSSTWSYNAANKQVVVHVKQTQDTSDGTPVYDTPLTIGLLSDAASGGIERREVQLNKADQEFRLPASTRPGSVLVDPDHDLLKEVKENNWADAELAAILLHAPDHIDRIAAARQIADADALKATRKDLFTRALASEPSEQVSEYLIEQLGELKDPALRSLLRAQIQREKPRRTAAALTALSKLPRDNADLTLIRPLAESDTLPYTVVESALHALGALDPEGGQAAILHQIGSHSLRDRLARTAIQVIGEAKQDAAAPMLIKAAQSDRPILLRTDAIDALGKLALKDTAVHEALVALLHDKNLDVQQAAVRAITDRDDKEAVPALRSLATSAADKELKQNAADAADNLSK